MAHSEPNHFNRTHPAAHHDIPLLPQYSGHKAGRSAGHCRTFVVLMYCTTIILAIVGAAVFLTLYVLRSRPVTYYVENAYLTEFNLTSKHTLRYHLNLDVNITNPHDNFGVYYQKLDTSAYYHEKLIGWVLLPGFYLRRKEAVMIHPAFGGQSVIVFSESSVVDFMEHRADGIYSIDVEIHAKMMLKIGAMMTHKFSQKIWCELMVPLVPSNNSGASRIGEFTRTECKVEFLNWLFPFNPFMDSSVIVNV
ncbi:NDR1/HIN1-like protein 10 [Nymphaea colorata]|uniref:Late embryogenesis abundant protein LEA-2 subgroup domain-containing protein n=1 Tax=Nymphaea colorata TaxID=210225 RepID=A0A5K0V9U4_9MAGN|nr:NDR1/HIN1-like protein 10 [Nymphaea colorata]